MQISDGDWDFVRKALNGSSFSVVMPFYRLVAAAETNLKAVADLFEEHRIEVELVPVDDGSCDGTDGEFLRIAENWNYSFVRFNPVVCRRNSGKGAALRAGFDAARGDFIMLLDGDLDIHPQQTPAFFKAMVENGADIVIGSKRHRMSDVQYPWHRRLISWCYFSLVKIFVGLPVTDTQTGMKLFKRKVLGEALSRMLVKTYAFDFELLSIAHSRGAKIAEAPVVIRFGQKFGALSLKTVKSMAWDSLAVFYRLRILRYYSRVEETVAMKRNPLVSVVIACPKRSWMLDESLRFLEKQTYENWEAIVLPDEDISIEVPSSKVRVIPTGKVRPAEKRNLGIREAKGEIIAFIDDDAYPEMHWIEYAVRYFGNESIGAVGGPGITPLGDSFLAKAGGRVYENILVSGNYRYRYKAGGVRRDVDDFPSCNLFVRKSLLESFGGYHTDFWPGEDTLLCKDIIDAGKRIVYDPWVVVSHHRRPLFMPHLRQLGRYAFHRGYFVKRYPSNSLHVSYFIPTLFVLYLISLLPVSAVSVLPRSEYQRLIYFLPFFLYAFFVLVTAFSFNPVKWLLTIAGVVSTHVTYGVRFAQGLLASKAPCEFIGSDHAPKNSKL
jgi:glycosyltransferase involved in cell wall biosynthesis